MSDGSPRRNERYYVARGGSIVGPVEAEQLEAWIAGGMTGAHFRPESRSDWIPADRAHFWTGVVPSAVGSVAPRPVAPPKPNDVVCFLLACVHTVRWTSAACLATVLGLGLATIALLAAPVNVMDSREFWVQWAERSPELRAARAGTDAALEQLAGELEHNQVIAGIGNPGTISGALRSARPKVHELISGHVIDATLGLLSGRDERLQLDLGLNELRRSVGQQIAQDFASQHCGAGGSRTGCLQSSAALQTEIYEQVWTAASTALDKYDVFSGRFLGTVIPTLGISRAIFIGLRWFIRLAWMSLAVLGFVVVLLSFRLRTASTLLAYAAFLAAATIYWCRSGANHAGQMLGISDWTWNLALESSGLMRGGLALEGYLALAAAALALARIVCPGWRRRFWERRLASVEPRTVERARARLSAPAGLLEPVHLLSARR